MMTTVQEHRFTCPLCGNPFESRLVASTNTFGRLHSDFYREASGAQPVCLFVHTCPGCGYTGFEGDFQPQSFPPEFAQQVAKIITPEVKGKDVGANGHYYLAALCAEWRGASHRELGRIYHMGAWCWRTRGDQEKEWFNLFMAVENFEAALRCGEVPEESRAMYAYIIGDIYRRMGEPDEANAWYGKVPELLKACGGDPKIAEYAERQMKEPKDIF